MTFNLISYAIKIIKKRRIDNIFFKKNPDRRAGKSKERICLQLSRTNPKIYGGIFASKVPFLALGYGTPP
jgi:hypothetical protein